ncbi:Deoxyadenosine/deoxycytidine kinase [Anaerosporobacter mobilis DSM 15930]|uniref:Deoxyadenosine/deoxycytidine kinase n=1 Tax=Anaerosporobacter mobilis DSM 15930 TaxID=1120996 RepID=A0A1M7FTF7_9FIRM|nr:deoxynucleoside kinase [Anaerosporobacter mobilis]SHM07205.1 Deoxyadenosine/deoxycytidine kinase [Anaerosporobacter mobilis DSM 15930]
MIKKNKPNETIVIDAVVGAGKTSYMEMLSEEMKIPCFQEPVQENPLLDKFYYDRKRYAFPLQIYFLNRRFEMLKQASESGEPSLMDRSIYGDMIFAKMLYEKGDMEKDEFILYRDLLTNMLDHVEAPKLMIYLKIDTDSAIERIKKRGRDYEQIVERDYWENLNKEYEDYFSNYNLSPLLVIEAAKYDIVGNLKDREKVLQIIREAM